MTLGRRNVIFHIDSKFRISELGSCLPPPPLGGKEDLREKVSAVGGDMAMRHGIILAKSIPAKKFHYKNGRKLFWRRNRNVRS